MGLWGGAAFDAWGKSRANDAAKSAYGGAIGTIEPERDRLRDFINTEYATSQGIRDLGNRYADASGQVLPGLIDSAQNPTVSPGFQRTSAEGLKAIQQNFATGGSAGSGAAQIAAGRFMTGLGDAERQRQEQTQRFVASLGTQAPSLSAAGNNILQLWPELNQMTGALASLRMGRGLNNTGFYQSMGQLGQETSLATAQLFANAAGGGLGGSAGIPSVNSGSTMNSSELPTPRPTGFGTDFAGGGVGAPPGMGWQSLFGG